MDMGGPFPPAAQEQGGKTISIHNPGPDFAKKGLSMDGTVKWKTLLTEQFGFQPRNLG